MFRTLTPVTFAEGTIKPTMGQVRKGFEDHFYSGMLDGKLVQGKLSELDEATLDAIAKSDPTQQMVIPSTAKQIAKPIAAEQLPIKPEPPKK